MHRTAAVRACGVTKASPIDPVADAKAVKRALPKQKVEHDEPDWTRTKKELSRVTSAKRIVITAAMNNAPLASREWATLRRYCKTRYAELLVVPLRYRNPTSPQQYMKYEAKVSWATEVTPFLVENRIKLHPLLWLMGDVPIAATAVNPLTGLESMSRGASSIFGHSQLAMETIPTPQNDLPKILHTTGAITEADYSRSKAGVKAEFHHALAALVVEKDGKFFHLRQLMFDEDGGFHDLSTYYHPKGVKKNVRAAALVTGDTHVDRADAKAVAATYGKGGIVATLKPEVLAWHDVVDFQSDSHHNDSIESLALGLAGKSDVRAEMTRAVEFIAGHTPKGTTSIVVPSNHHDHPRQWALRKDWRSIHPVNAEFLLELQLAMVRGAKVAHRGVEQVDPLAWWAFQYLDDHDNIYFLALGESFRVKGVELSFHGDRGPSGSRGSRRGLNRTGTRMTIGHSHSPGIFKGVWQTGTTSVLDMVFTLGAPSAQMNTHCVVHQNGKRQLIHIIGGHWRGA